MADSFDFRSDAMWDDLVSGIAPDLEGDAGAAGALRFTHSLSQTPIPGSARERARQRVFDSISVSQENDMTALTLPASLPVTNGHSPGLRSASARPAADPAPISRRHFWLSLAAVLALLLAGLSGWFVYDRLSGNDPVPAIIPAVQEATPTTGANDWPMYRGNPGRTGAMPGSGPKSDVGAVWSVKVDGSAYRSPIVVGDTAYVGASSGTLYALDADTGEERWTFTGDGSLEITPAYLDGIVYVPSLAGTLYAIDATTGEELWRFAQPTAEFATPTFGDGLLFVGSETNNALYGIDPKTGDEVWHFDTGGAINRGQAYAEGVLYSGSDGGILYALDAANGTLKWQYDAQQESLGTPAVADGIVYTTSPTGQLILVDAGTAKEIKRIDTTSTDGITPPTIGNGLIYIGTWQETIDAIDPEHEQVIWSYPTHQTIRAALALVDDVIYGVGLDNTVFALDASSGAELWTYQVDGGMDFGPTVANGMVYVSTDGGEVAALGEGGAAPATPAPDASPVASAGFDQSQIEVLWSVTADETNPLARPGGMAIAPDGNIYITDGMTDTILVYSPDGKLIEQWGETGTGHGQFRFHLGAEYWFSSIAFDADGNFYVFDTYNVRIQKFAPDHTFLLEWGSEGKGNGEFDYVVAGTVDAKAGLVYVADYGNDRVQVFDLDGNYLDKWGGTGTAPGQFRAPTFVAVDPQGNVYVSEEDGRRVQKFDATGRYLDSSAPTGSLGGPYRAPVFTATDAAGRLFVSDWALGKIEIVDPDGVSIGVIDTLPGLGALTEPTGIVFDADGNLILGQESAQRIVKIALPPLE